MDETTKAFIEKNRGMISEILWDYTHFLAKEGYTDSDYYTEEPYAVDRYLEDNKII